MKTLKVGPHTYRVERVPGLLRDTDDYGRCLNENLRIELDAEMMPTHALQTLLHETIHAIEHLHGLAVDEKTVDRLASGLATVAVDNRWRIPI